jgi:hypothetical protein
MEAPEKDTSTVFPHRLKNRNNPMRMVFLTGKHGFSQALPRSVKKMAVPNGASVYQSFLTYGLFFRQPSRFPSGRL